MFENFSSFAGRPNLSPWNAFAADLTHNSFLVFTQFDPVEPLSPAAFLLVTIRNSPNVSSSQRLLLLFFFHKCNWSWGSNRGVVDDQSIRMCPASSFLAKSMSSQAVGAKTLTRGYWSGWRCSTRADVVRSSPTLANKTMQRMKFI